MIHYVHQLDANCVCQPFGAYPLSLEERCFPENSCLLETVQIRVLMLNQNNKAAVVKPKQLAKRC